MRVFAVLAIALLVCVAAEKTEDEYTFLFNAWKLQHGRDYTGDEHAIRYNIFKDNARIIEAHNLRNDVSYTMGLNKFSDLSHDEFKAQMTSPMAPRVQKNIADFSNAPAAPAAVDWVAKGAVTPVKNQQQCGSCWAFSTTGSTEGIHQITTGKLVSLSEQELVDCGTKEGSHGCSGGLMDYGFQFIIDNKGICTEQAYPYEAKDDQCRASKCTNAVEITGFSDVKSESEDDLLAAVAQQPVSVAIEADQSCFQSYTGGVMDDPSCGTQLDHGVLVVGYGTDGGKDYWKVKNSWGGDWGENGYIRLARKSGTGSGECGIAVQPSFPKASKNSVAGADPIWSSCGTAADHLKDVNVVITPNPPVKGSDVTVSVTGNLDEQITKGSVSYAITYLGIKIYSATQSLCDDFTEFITCPIKAGAFKLDITEKLPASIPGGEYKAHVKLADQGGSEIACIDADLSF